MSGKIVFISSLKQVDHPIFTNKICSKKTKGRMINRLKPFLLIFIFIHLLPLKNQAQDFLQTSGKAIINSTTGDTVILRGMGLGGWMLQEGYMLQTASFANAQYKIKQHIEDLIGTTGMELFYEKWPQMFSGPIQENIELFKNLKKTGQYKMYALTNWSAEKWDIALELFPFFNEFDGTVVSGLVKTRKPFPEIYKILLNKFNIEPENAIFIDDNNDNILAAKALKINGIRFKNHKQLIQNLEYFNINY